MDVHVDILARRGGKVGNGVSEENKAVLRRIDHEVFSQGRLEVADEVVAADAVDHSPPPGSTGDARQGLKAFAGMARSAFPDASFRSVVEVAEGDKVVIASEMTGTHQGGSWACPRAATPSTGAGWTS